MTILAPILDHIGLHRANVTAMDPFSAVIWGCTGSTPALIGLGRHRGVEESAVIVPITG